MDIYLIILIVVVFIIILVISILAHNINKTKESIANILSKYSEMKINTCISDKSDNKCLELLNIIDRSKEIITLTKDVENRNIYLYSIQLIVKFLIYLASNVSYENTDILKEIPGCTNPNFIFTSKDTKPIAFIFLNKDINTIYIIFRGTQTINDAIIDISYDYYNVVNPDYNTDLMHIHKEYLSIYNDIKNKIVDNINSITKNYISISAALESSTQPISTQPSSEKLINIFICGHSMGAGLSYILAEDISSNKEYNVKVVGIAPPKVGNKIFTSSLYDKCSYVMSVINMSDIIPSMPWSYMPNKFSNYEPVEFSIVTPCFIFNNLAPSIAACHQPITYYNGIKNNKFSVLHHN